MLITAAIIGGVTGAYAGAGIAAHAIKTGLHEARHSTDAETRKAYREYIHATRRSRNAWRDLRRKYKTWADEQRRRYPSDGG